MNTRARCAAKDATITAYFILRHCYEVDGSLISFGEFRERFLAWLPKHERYQWSHIRLSKSLPPEHRSGRYTANISYLPNLSW